MTGCVCPTCGNRHFKKKRRKILYVQDEPEPAPPPAPATETPPVQAPASLEDLEDL